MLDYSCATEIFKSDSDYYSHPELFPSTRLLNAVASLSEGELEALEDELNFYSFTRLEGPMVRHLKAKLN